MDDCDHTIKPTGYVQWHEWAEKMTKTHKQTQCPHCKKWAIWVPKTKATKKKLTAPDSGMNEERL